MLKKSDIGFICVVFLSLLMSFHIASLIYKNSAYFRPGDARHSLFLAYKGGLERPYTYRLLLPAASRAIVALTPSSLIPHIDIFLKNNFFPKYVPNAFTAATGLLYGSFLIFLFSITGLLIFGLSTYSIALILSKNRIIIALMSVLIGYKFVYICAPIFPKYYDFPTLAFSAACFLFMIKRSWYLYLFTFGMGCLNRETIILQTIIFSFAFYRRLSLPDYYKLICAQFFLYIIINLMSHYIYAYHPGFVIKARGPVMLYVWWKNLNFIKLLFYAALGMLLVIQWQNIPYLLKCGLLIIPMNAGLYFLFGYTGEYRVFMDCIPILGIIISFIYLDPLYNLLRKLSFENIYGKQVA